MKQPLAVVPPIIVWEPRNLDLFASVNAASSYLEPPEVAAHSFSAYDSEGRKLRFEVRSEPVRAFGISLWHTSRVRLVESEAEPIHASELREVLLSALGLDVTAVMTLKDLVALAQSRFGLS